MANDSNGVNINTGKTDSDSNTYQEQKDKQIPLKEGVPNYVEQTEMDNDEVRIEQNQDQGKQ